MRLRRFYHYTQRVFDFQGHVNQLNDFRQAAAIPTASLFEAMFLGFVLHLPSFRALEFQIKQGQVRKVMRHRCDFHINSLRYGTHQFEIETLDAMLVCFSRKMKRAKMLRDTIDGLHVAAIDGTEFFRSEAIHCSECLPFQVSKKVKSARRSNQQEGQR